MNEKDDTEKDDTDKNNIYLVSFGAGSYLSIITIINIIFLCIYWNDTCDKNLINWLFIWTIITSTGISISIIMINRKGMNNENIIMKIMLILFLLCSLALAFTGMGWYIYGWVNITNTKDCRELIPAVWNLILIELLLPIILPIIGIIILCLCMCGVFGCLSFLHFYKNKKIHETNERIEKMKNDLFDSYQKSPLSHV